MEGGDIPRELDLMIGAAITAIASAADARKMDWKCMMMIDCGREVGGLWIELM